MRNEIIVYCKSQYWVSASISCTRKTSAYIYMSRGESQTTNRQPETLWTTAEEKNCTRKKRVCRHTIKATRIDFNEIHYATRVYFFFLRRLRRTGWVLVIARKLNQSCMKRAVQNRMAMLKSTHIFSLFSHLWPCFGASTFNFPEIATWKRTSIYSMIDNPAHKIVCNCHLRNEQHKNDMISNTFYRFIRVNKLG